MRKFWRYERDVLALCSLLCTTFTTLVYVAVGKDSTNLSRVSEVQLRIVGGAVNLQSRLVEARADDLEIFIEAELISAFENLCAIK